jgi:hypothetical protein
MNKPLFIFFGLIIISLIVTLASFASATDIAYVVKTSTSENIESILNELNYTYNVIIDSAIPSTNFSNYNMILIGDGSLSNADKIPVKLKKSLILNHNNLNKWNISNSASDYHIANGYTSGKSITNNSINQNLSSPIKFYTTYNSLGPIAWRLPNIGPYSIGRACGIINIVATNNYNAYPVIGIINPGGKLWEGKSCSSTTLTAKERILYFGITETSYWTNESKKLFENSVLWVMRGEDLDGDGFYTDSDCNDSNKNVWQYLPGYIDNDSDGFGAGSLKNVCSGSSLPTGYSNIPGDCNDNNSEINPNAKEIPYDYIDNDCNGYDLADVDGDGDCSIGYFIINKTAQCNKENSTAILGTDCNDNDSSINPGAIDIIDNIDQNCKNDMPVLLSNIISEVWPEDHNKIDIYNLSYYFADPEGDNLSFYAVGNENITIEIDENGIVNLFPKENWNGIEKVYFWASDGELERRSNEVSLQVSPVNDAPILQPINNIVAIEGDLITIPVNASDVDDMNSNLRFSFSAPFNNSGEWQTNIGNAGSHNIFVYVYDLQNASDYQSVNVNVLPKLYINEFVSNPSEGNDWIEIYNPGNKTTPLSNCIFEDASDNNKTLNGSISSRGFVVFDWSNRLDKDRDNISLICSNLTIDYVSYGSSGQIEAPDEGKSAGRSKDGKDSGNATADFVIFDFPTKGISNSADKTPPIVTLLSPANDSFFNVNGVLFNFTATDNNSTILNCSFYSDVNNTVGRFEKLADGLLLPIGLIGNFNAHNIPDGNYIWDVNCIDSNGNSAFAHENWTFEVNVPDAPKFEMISNKTVNENELLSFTVNATDADGDNLTYSAENRPEGAIFDSQTQTFSWTPTFEQSGKYNVEFIVNDGTGLEDRKNITITVLNVDRAPILIENISDQRWDEDNILELNMSNYFEDADKDNLTFYSDISNNFTINKQGNIITIIPKKDWYGTENVFFWASDGALNASSNVFELNVTPVNDAPVLNPIANVTKNEGEKVIIIANATDIDNSQDGLIFDINSIKFNQTSKGVFEWQTNYSNAGIYDFNIGVSDGNLSDSKTVKITVNDNTAPSIDSYYPLFNPIIAKDKTYNFGITWHDIDNPSEVSVSWYVNDNFNSTGNSFDFISYDLGEHEIKVVVSDGEWNDSYSWDVLVTDTPIATNYNGETTNFSSLTNLSNVNLILEKTHYGKIRFLNPVNLNGQVDFDRYSNIGVRIAGIDSDYFTGLKNHPAEITLNELNFNKTPTIYYSNTFTTDYSNVSQVCPVDLCSDINYDSETGILNFLVSGFSTFLVGDTLTCSQQGGNVCSNNQVCNGNLITALDSNSCCLGQCIEIPPEFTDIEDKCENLSSNLTVSIGKPTNNKNFKIGDTINIKIKATNKLSDSIDGDIEVILYDITKDEEIKSVSQDISINSKDSETAEFKIKIPYGVEDENDFVIFAMVDAQNEEEVCNQAYVPINIEREREKVIISDFSIPQTLSCGEDIQPTINIENIGKKNEKVYLVLESPELNINEKTDSFELEKFDGNNDAKKSFLNMMPITAQNRVYNVKASVFSESGKLLDSVTNAVNIVNCIPQQEQMFENIPTPLDKEETAKINQKSMIEDSQYWLLIGFLIFGILIIILLMILISAKNKRDRNFKKRRALLELER